MADAPTEIRLAKAADGDGVFAVHVAAFPSDGEARLVELLTRRGKARISIVAVCEARVVGHVLFSPVQVHNASGYVGGLGLAPLAVLPAFQRQRIGSRLVEAGLAVCRQLGDPFVVVLGDPEYYGRFGFCPARLHGLSNEYGAEDAFMVLKLTSDGLSQIGGLVKYAPEFAEVFGG